MAIVTFILGKSGTGKSTSMRNLDQAQTLLIQALKKPLPFRAKAWGYLSKDTPRGNVIVSDHSETIIKYMQRTQRKVIVIDDFQYIMSSEFMRRSDEKGYEKFTEIGRHAWDILNACTSLPDDVRVYIMSHTDTDDNGNTKMKSIGKMLDDKICLEGMVTIVLQTDVMDRDYRFITQNNGRNTCKSPMGLFGDDTIPNDLFEVDGAIRSYYELEGERQAA